MLKTKLLPLPCNYLKDKVVLKEMQKGSKIKKTNNKHKVMQKWPQNSGCGNKSEKGGGVPLSHNLSVARGCLDLQMEP